MTPIETAATLRQFNKWLRGSKDGPQLESRMVLKAIGAAVETIDRLEAVEKERDTLCAKIERMERQGPVAWMLNCPTLGGGTGWILSWTQSGAGLCNRLSGEENEKKLYALPGAQGEEK